MQCADTECPRSQPVATAGVAALRRGTRLMRGRTAMSILPRTPVTISLHSTRLPRDGVRIRKTDRVKAVAASADQVPSVETVGVGIVLKPSFQSDTFLAVQILKTQSSIVAFIPGH